MKKIRFFKGVGENPPVTKLIRTMKLTCLLITFALLQVSAETYSQTKKLTLNLKNTPLSVLFEEIEKTSEFHFFYDSGSLDLSQKVTVAVEDSNIEEVLEKLFSDSGISYEIFDRYIILKGEEKRRIREGFFAQQQQQHSISGKVTDTGGEPLPGVTVVVKGTTQGTVTNAGGEYSLANIPTNATLQFSFVGMRMQEVEVGNQTLINISMEEETFGLEEVVAIGYGTQKKVNVIGSVTTVNNDELTAAPVGRIANALTGRMPGATIMQSSGEPGNDAPSIRIRGNSTLGNNAPLIVVDGIPGRDLNSLHPEDIESITVLKDAAAGIYGARAANGVILVTTKRGDFNKAPTFTYRFSEGFLTPTMLPEMTDAATYATMIRENQSYRGVEEANMMYSEEDIVKYASGEYPWTHPNTNWFDSALRRYSSTRHHSFSVAGGAKSINYYTSFGYQLDDGIYKNNNTSYNRYNLKAALNIKINEYISLGIDIAGAREDKMYGTKSASSNFTSLIRMYPTSHALFPNGLPGPDIERGDQPMVSASAETGFNDDQRYRSNNMLSAQFIVPGVEGLSLSGYFAYDVYFQQRKLFQKPWTLYSFNKDAYLAAGNTGKEDGSDFLLASSYGYSEPRLTNYSTRSDSRTTNLKIDYTRSFADVHNLSAFVSYESFEYYYQSFNAFRRYFLSDKLPYLFAGGDAEKSNGESVDHDARMNFFGRASYNYKETYMLQFSFRRDGSLRFSKEAGRWGNFPSVLLGWRPSNYEWWKDSFGFIDYLKFKASWGQMGNDAVPAYQYLSSYRFSGGYALGNSQDYNLGLVQANTPNPHITWEVANMFNVGWESMLWDSRINFDTDLFYERRNNILITKNASVPQFTGLELPDENFGIVDSKGIELVLGYSKTGGDFTYKINGNFSFARNKIVEYDEPERNVAWQERTGLPQNALLLYRSLGIFRDEEHVNSLPHLQGARPGDIIIEDYDKDGKITNDDRQLFPLTTTPEINYGLSFNLNYRNFELTGLFHGAARGMRRAYYEIQGTGGNYLQWASEDRWTPENTNASKPRAFERIEEYWRQDYITDFDYMPISFLRLKNLQLKYTIPQSVLGYTKVVKDFNVYFSGQNLWLVYSGNEIMDPEVSNVTSYPLMKVYSLGAQITF